VNDKKYMSLDLDKNTYEQIVHIQSQSQKNVKHLINPLEGNTLRVKAPFRYNRVMCNVSSGKTIQELVKGDNVQVTLKYCGWWESGGYGGPSWKLTSCCYFCGYEND
jgi:hypothetical protein